MKKYLFTMFMALAVFFSFSSSLFAINEYEEEDESFTYSVYGGYGVLSVPYMFSGFLEILAFSFTAPFDDDQKTIKDNGSFGPIFLGADFYGSDNFSYGGLIACENVSRRWLYEDASGNETGHADWNWLFLSVMGRLNVQYGWDYFKFYHSLMVGGSYVGLELVSTDGQSRSSSDFIPGAHLVLLGIKIGREFSFFADFGIGYLGMINFGVAYSF